MAIKNTTFTLDASTASTGTMIPLSGHANWIYFSVEQQTYAHFERTTNSTGTGEGLGQTISTGSLPVVFQFHPGDAKYLFHVSTAAGPACITEVY